MKKIFSSTFFYFFAFLGVVSYSNAKAQGFDRSTYYKVMENGNADAINKQIKIIESVPNINKEAYTGALLMKKASQVKGASKKLSVFKEGHNKLETAIEKDAQNAEWRFLRLIIQENAPKILNYRGDKKKDAVFILNNFNKLSAEVQSAVMDYRKHSDTLQPLNF